MNPDPTAASNADSGSTVWCDAVGGTVVSGDGTAADCPQTAASVTAIRALRSGNFTSDDDFRVQVRTVADLNNDADHMINRVIARAQGIDAPITSQARIDFIPTRQFGAGTVSGMVWDDVDGDGVRESGERPIAGAVVHLRGTDSQGAAIDLTTTTDADGVYRFSALFEGTYTVTFDAPDGMVPTRVTGGDPARSSVGPVTTVTVTARDKVVDDVNAGFTDPGELAVTKTVTPSGDRPARPGDTLVYTVTVTNTGPGAWSAASPARVVDDLTGVLDDATWKGDAVAAAGSVTRVGRQLHWTGPIAAGETVTISYSVTVTSAGDLSAENIAFITDSAGQPGAVPVPDTCPEPTCAKTTTPLVLAGPEPSPEPSRPGMTEPPAPTDQLADTGAPDVRGWLLLGGGLVLAGGLLWGGGQATSQMIRRVNRLPGPHLVAAGGRCPLGCRAAPHPPRTAATMTP